MAIRMELSRILIRELVDYQVIELREAEPAGDTPRTFPIVIGLPEAQAIERRLSGTEVKRPQTHDLLASVLTALGARLESISVVDLSEGTFFATLDVRTANGEMLHIDSRPSDAMALGIGARVPIFVAEEVIDAAARADALDPAAGPAGPGWAELDLDEDTDEQQDGPTP